MSESMEKPRIELACGDYLDLYVSAECPPIRIAMKPDDSAGGGIPDGPGSGGLISFAIGDTGMQRRELFSESAIAEIDADNIVKIVKEVFGAEVDGCKYLVVRNPPVTRPDDV